MAQAFYRLLATNGALGKMTDRELEVEVAKTFGSVPGITSLRFTKNKDICLSFSTSKQRNQFSDQEVMFGGHCIQSEKEKVIMLTGTAWGFPAEYCYTAKKTLEEKLSTQLDNFNRSNWQDTNIWKGSVSFRIFTTRPEDFTGKRTIQLSDRTTITVSIESRQMRIDRQNKPKTIIPEGMNPDQNEAKEKITEQNNSDQEQKKNNQPNQQSAPLIITNNQHQDNMSVDTPENTNVESHQTIISKVEGNEASNPIVPTREDEIDKKESVEGKTSETEVETPKKHSKRTLDDRSPQTDQDEKKKEKTNHPAPAMSTPKTTSTTKTSRSVSNSFRSHTASAQVVLTAPGKDEKKGS